MGYLYHGMASRLPDDVERIVAGVEQELPAERNLWFTPGGYAHLAHCVVDSIYSLSLNYFIVEAVIHRRETPYGGRNRTLTRAARDPLGRR